MVHLDSDPIDGIEAEPADVLEQAQPPASEPVGDALASRSRFDATGSLDGVDAEPADVLEQAQSALPGGGPDDLDPESTGIEDEETDDSRQA